MLRSRIIPTLLIKGSDLVKTINFSKSIYLGDPLNTVKIFNEKKVDELVILDIDATSKNKEPNYALLEKIASVSRMPLAYGGGVKNIEQFQRIIRLGVEKVVISNSFIRNKNLIKQCAYQFGSQSVVVCLDIKVKGIFKKRYKVCLNNGKDIIREDFVDLAKSAEEFGAGELIINSIDREGTYSGFDLEVIDEIINNINIPITLVGGASSHEDIKSLFSKYKIIGAGVGSLFVFKGKYKAVLIQYPTIEERLLIQDQIN